MKYFVFLLISISILSSSVFADEQTSSQVIAPSWHGLSGLYTVPTARTIGAKKIALNFSEPKHVEYVPGKGAAGRFMDRQVRQNIVYGINDNLEVWIGKSKNILDYAWVPKSPNPNYFMYGIKYQVIKENREKGIPAIAIAVRDIGDEMKDLKNIKGVYNGRKYYLLATKKISQLSNGKFADITLGVAKNEKCFSEMFGLELGIADDLSFIAEGTTDSNFINFRDYGKNDVNGRFTYNTGLRFTPETMKGTVIDAGFIGDGAFEFSFGWSFIHQF
jgi:hypothetical protein